MTSIILCAQQGDPSGSSHAVITTSSCLESISWGTSNRHVTKGTWILMVSSSRMKGNCLGTAKEKLPFSWLFTTSKAMTSTSQAISRPPERSALAPVQAGPVRCTRAPIQQNSHRGHNRRPETHRCNWVPIGLFDCLGGVAESQTLPADHPLVS